jgi:[acyl-carrier-protein] S-malonyltransferase
MASAQPKLDAALGAIPLQAPSVPVISNVTAEPHGEPGSIRERLVEQVTATVRWESSMRYLLAQGFTRFIELGPGNALSGFMKRIDKTVEVLSIGDWKSLEHTCQTIATQ